MSCKHDLDNCPECGPFARAGQDEPLATMIRNLRRCVFGVGSNAKRFVRQMAFRLDRGENMDAGLTEKQKTYLRGLRHNYRKQIAALPGIDVDDDIPHTDAAANGLRHTEWRRAGDRQRGGGRGVEPW